MRYSDIQDEIVAGTAAATLPQWARGVLGAIAEGRAPLNAVRHPLGFLCIPVERTGVLGVCLHIWSPEVAPVPATTSGVHCHSWELVSFVLYGSVRNTRADVADAPAAGPDGATHRVFEVVSEGEVDELRATGRTVRYAAGDAVVHGGGTVYSLPAGVFHSTLIEGGPDAATVALGRQERARGDLSLGPLDTGSHRMRRMRSDPDETARAALRSARRIEAAHPDLREPPHAGSPPAQTPPAEPGRRAGDPDPPGPSRRPADPARR
jgi:hypothetical protein